MATYTDYSMLTSQPDQPDSWDASSLVYYPVAVVADLGVSIANSFLWGDSEIDTYDILGGASSDIAQFYLDNQDAVELGSFVAGMAIPFGSTRLVSSLMKYATTGKPSRILTPIRYLDKKLEASKSQALKIAQEVGVEDKAYKQAINKVRLQSISKQGLENVAWELNALALMNGHAYMQDYDMADFGWSMAIGGALAPIGMLADMRQVKNAIGDIEAQATARVKEYVTPTVEGEGISRGATVGILAKQMQKQEEALTGTLAAQDQEAIQAFNIQTKRELYDGITSLLDNSATKLLKPVGTKQEVPDFTKPRDYGHDPAEALAELLRSNPAALDGAKKGSIAHHTINDRPWALGDQETGSLYQAVDTGLVELDSRLATPGEYAALVKDATKVEDYVVIDTWDGKPLMMDGATARAAATPANNPDWMPSPNAFIGTGKEYALDRSVHAIDSDFLNNLAAARGLSKTVLTSGKLSVHPGALEELTALRARTLELRLEDVSIKVGDTTVTSVDDLTKEVMRSKYERMAALIEQNPLIDNIQIAKATNSPLKLVQDFRESGGTIAKGYPEYPTIKYSSTNIKEYLRPMQLRIAAPDAIQQAKQKELLTGLDLDRRTIENVRQQVVASVVDSSSSKWLKQAYNEIIDHPGMKQLINEPERLTSKVLQGKVAFSSADMALRNLGDQASIIISLGRNMETLATQFVKQEVESLQPLMREFQADHTARIMWYKLERQFAAMSGKEAARYKWNAKTGQFLTKDGEVLKWADTGNPIDIPEGKLRDFIGIYKNTTDKILEITNGVRALRGDAPLKPLGLWIPRPSTKDSYIAYVINNATKETKQIIGTSREDMIQKLDEARKATRDNPDINIITYDQTDDWNRIHRHAAINQIDRADSELGRKGIGFENIPSDMSGFEALLQGLGNEARARLSQFVSAGASPLFDTLDSFRQLQHQVDKGKWKKPIFMADIVKKTLLNQGLQADTPIIKMSDNAFTEALTYTLKQGDRVKQAFKELLGNKDATDLEFMKVAKDAEKLGFRIDWETPAQYAAATGAPTEASAKSFIGRTNALHALFALRLGELSHAVVTTLSAPIVMSAELKALGAPMKYMLEAVKMVASKAPEDVAIMQRGADLKYTTRQIAEYNEFMAGLVATPSKIDKLTNDGYKFINWLTKPSDKAEELVREVAYATGYLIAKDKLPNGVDARLLEVHANGFVNRVMGNYTSKQRPTMFQGAGGAMIGLYKTFVLTYGQNLIRYVEQGQKPAVLTLMGAQSAMFGATSLPGYSAFNELLGAHISSSDHTDINQTVYQSMGRDTAEFILYGLPSTVFQTALSTRAEINPISPVNFSNGAVQFSPPAISALMDAANMAWDTAKQVGRMATGSGSIVDVERAITQGLSTQYLNRPVARIAELLQGYSIDRKGETIQQIGSPLEEPWAYVARVFGARPLEDQVVRQLRYQNSYYNFVDTTRKRQVIEDLRLTLRGDGSAVPELMQRYLDAGGTYRGWSQVLQRAYLSIGPDYARRLADKSTTQDGIAAILDEYAY